MLYFSDLYRTICSFVSTQHSCNLSRGLKASCSSRIIKIPLTSDKFNETKKKKKKTTKIKFNNCSNSLGFQNRNDKKRKKGNVEGRLINDSYSATVHAFI